MNSAPRSSASCRKNRRRDHFRHRRHERPPFEQTAPAKALFDHAARLAAEIGFELVGVTTGGGSDGNFTAPYAATLDGSGLTAKARIPITSRLTAVDCAKDRVDATVDDDIGLRRHVPFSPTFRPETCHARSVLPSPILWRPLCFRKPFSGIATSGGPNASASTR